MTTKALVTSDFLDGVTLSVVGSHIAVNDTSKVALTLVGAPNGVASLGPDGRVPSAYLPSSLETIIEYANLAAFPLVGTTGVIYVALNTQTTYRWSGSVYVALNPSPGSTDAIPEGLTNLYYTNSRARAALTVTGNLSYNPSTGVMTGPNLSSYVTSTGLTTTLSSYVAVAALPTYLSSYVTSTSLSTTLAGYVTSGVLTAALSPYATTASLSGYVTSAYLTSTLTSYVTNSSLSATLASTLSGYVTSTSLSTTLSGYPTNSSLTTTLSGYVTSSALTTTLGNYVTTASLGTYITEPMLSTTLSSYVLTSSLGSYAFSTGQVNYNEGGTSSVTRTVTTKLQESVSVKDFGATGNGVTDDTAAIQAAINTGRNVYLPAGTYLITNKLSFSTRGQQFKGDGTRLSSLIVNSGFNMGATAVLGITNIETEFRDLWIKFSQPDTTNRASLTTYPVAINCAGIGGAIHLRDVSITNATNGIDMTGNCGQTVIENLTMSAYGTGISIDGSLDTVRINAYHFWPYDLTGNQQSIFFAAPTRAFSVGRIDGLFISKFLNISNLGLYTFQGATGRPWIYISESAFDTFNGIQCTAGQLQMSNSYITLADSAGLYAIQQSGSGSAIQLDNCLFFLGPSTGIPAIKMMGGTEMKLMANNCFMDNYVSNNYVFALDSSATNSLMEVSNTTFNFGSGSGYVATATGGVGNKLHLQNNYIATIPNAAYSAPMVNVNTSVRAHIAGNRINDKGSSPATFVYVQSADYHMVTTNMAPGWTYTLPGAGAGFYGNNI